MTSQYFSALFMWELYVLLSNFYLVFIDTKISTFKCTHEVCVHTHGYLALPVDTVCFYFKKIPFFHFYFIYLLRVETYTIHTLICMYKEHMYSKHFQYTCTCIGVTAPMDYIKMWTCVDNVLLLGFESSIIYQISGTHIAHVEFETIPLTMWHENTDYGEIWELYKDVNTFKKYSYILQMLENFLCKIKVLNSMLFGAIGKSWPIQTMLCQQKAYPITNYQPIMKIINTYRKYDLNLQNTEYRDVWFLGGYKGNVNICVQCSITGDGPF